MDDETRNELGILYARIEYLRVVSSILLSKLTENERVQIGIEVQKHYAEHKEAAINSTFPDSYLQEFENYVPKQQAETEKRSLARK